MRRILPCGISVVLLVSFPDPATFPLNKCREKMGEEGLVQLLQKGSMGCSMSMAYWEW